MCNLGQILYKPGHLQLEISGVHVQVLLIPSNSELVMESAKLSSFLEHLFCYSWLPMASSILTLTE